jgi:hypothetical protein
MYESNMFSVIIKMKKLFTTLFLTYLFPAALMAQDTLPGFTLRNVGNNRIIVSWTNKFENVKQISIQRSRDSLTNFKTILTVPDPNIPENGYMDTRAEQENMFYRLYILVDKGVFIFSGSKRPVWDTVRTIAVLKDDDSREESSVVPFPDDKLEVWGKLDVSGKLEKFRINAPDSASAPGIGISTKVRPDMFIPSLHVHTHKDGYLRINLPDDENRKFSIKFFEDDGTFLFEMKEIRERTVKIDKTAFYSAGWYRFELYEGNRLIEKHKFYLEKDF